MHHLSKINYAYILCMKEKDNPSPICRGSYLFSNVGDLVKCYGRKLRFPDDTRLYEAEMKLALGDIIMQCRLIENELNLPTTKWDEFRNSPDDEIFTDIYTAISTITSNSEYVLEAMIDKEVNDTLDEEHLGVILEALLWSCYNMCKLHEWTPEEVSHLGFLHVMERFEQFEREGWK